jgi:hypothetical protein
MKVWAIRDGRAVAVVVLPYDYDCPGCAEVLGTYVQPERGRAWFAASTFDTFEAAHAAVTAL